MKDRLLQFTMRELRRNASSPLMWWALASASIVLGLAGPFGTYEALALPGRLGFWSLVVVATYFTGFGTVVVLEGLLFRERPHPLAFALLGALSGPPVAGVVWLINRWVFEASVIGYWILVVNVSVVAAVASGTIALFSKRLAGDVTPAGNPERARAALMDRLPAHLRGTLSHLSMQDHYVEVVTDKGSHLLLLRLSDAIAETQGIDGLQIHRSHWVARHAVARVERSGERMTLEMRNGEKLPVSRARMKDIRDAGLT
ncbi:LytTR family DNA-binding domain-containing protein [Mesorhizobium sp. CAU 1741]|uniref:LytTR family DNA-binding domain-containing protein n=1 Tax=Mesorhizobium sp. CAU 1741 TaxID=3140366 RepID=UPI00325C2F08